MTDLSKPHQQLLRDVVLARNGHKSAQAAADAQPANANAKFNLRTERERLDAALFEARDLIVDLIKEKGIE